MLLRIGPRASSAPPAWDATELSAPGDSPSLTDLTELSPPDDLPSLPDVTERRPALRARSAGALHESGLSVTEGQDATLLDGGAALRADMASQRHETQHTRLFRS